MNSSSSIKNESGQLNGHADDTADILLGDEDLIDSNLDFTSIPNEPHMMSSASSTTSSVHSNEAFLRVKSGCCFDDELSHFQQSYVESGVLNNLNQNERTSRKPLLKYGGGGSGHNEHKQNEFEILKSLEYPLIKYKWSLPSVASI